MSRLWWRTKRAWAMLRAYWATDDYDWVAIAIVMRHQIRRTREHLAEHQLIGGWEYDCQRMALTEHMLTRVIDDAALLEAPDGDWKDYIRRDARDWRILGKLVQRYMREWWD